MQNYSGNIIDIEKKEIYPGTVYVQNGKITSIQRENRTFERYILPGFIDSHIHIESSMLPPSEFARISSTHGTVACVADAHEIANVLGLEGVNYMIENGKRTPFKFYFSAPSCVPATKMETSGAKISLEDIECLFKNDEIKFLGEMMNFPGVIHKESETMQKLDLAKKYNKKIDGHAPGLEGSDLEKYAGAGISADHESFTKDEALEKIELGMKIQIREGSAAKNFDELIELAFDHHEHCMFCSDDKHPDELLEGHIDLLVKRAINTGVDIFKVLQIACLNPIKHYGLDVGILRPGDPADFIIIDNLTDLNVKKTIIEGIEVAENKEPKWHFIPAENINNFNTGIKSIEDFEIHATKTEVKTIDVIDHQLVTEAGTATLNPVKGNLVSDIDQDVLKIAVVNRYNNSLPALGFVRNFGLKKGAIASSVAHDSHNIIVVGTNDQDIVSAVNKIIEKRGGICAISQKEGIEKILALPIAGLMSDCDYLSVAKDYEAIDALAKDFGSKLHAPLMTLSFMALLVIPKIKLSDQGLFDVRTFGITDLFV